MLPYAEASHGVGGRALSPSVVPSVSSLTVATAAAVEEEAEADAPVTAPLPPLLLEWHEATVRVWWLELSEGESPHSLEQCGAADGGSCRATPWEGVVVVGWSVVVEALSGLREYVEEDNVETETISGDSEEEHDEPTEHGPTQAPPLSLWDKPP
eukprot:RCo021220